MSIGFNCHARRSFRATLGRLPRLKLLLVVIVEAVLIPANQSTAANAFTPTQRIPLHILTNAASYSAGFSAAQLIDGDLKTEYASDNRGTNTFVEFGFKETEVVAFRHVDRADRALVGASELVFRDGAGQVVDRVTIRHMDQKSGETFEILPHPIRASRVRWQVTQLGKNAIGTVGGAEVELFSAEPREPSPVRDEIAARTLPFVDKQGEQPVEFIIQHPYLEPVEVALHIADHNPQTVRLKHGENVFTTHLRATRSPTERKVAVLLGNVELKTTNFLQRPVRPLTVYILAHSHTDIGYTEIQTAIATKQVNNLVRGMELARRTADYPEGARFVWNVEALWAADLFLERMSSTEKNAFVTAVRTGQVELNGMYLNELTGLCRPEELIQLFRFATRMADITGRPIRSAMISDVPGYTWGTVTAMDQAGIRYLSAGPNYGERAFMREWENKPFYWIGPDQKSKVLVWVPFQGYALAHIYDQMSSQLLDDLCAKLQQPDYPYDLTYIRWAGRGDNGVPDPEICEFVKEWNEQHTSPKLVISGTTEPFRALEERYGKSLPEFRGDWTPYWEDGAGSSAHETSMNRQTAERLTQAQTLFALFNPKAYSAAAFHQAWRNVLLYSEHTWGASDSISQPESARAREQWAIKKSYADQAEQESRALVAKALQREATRGSSLTNEIEVINTLSWERTEIVNVPPDLSRAGDQVFDETGTIVPSQRLKTGELAFLARAVPPFAKARYRIGPGAAREGSKGSKAQGNVLENESIQLEVDERTGGIKKLKAGGILGNFAGESHDEQLNRFLYFQGVNSNAVQTSSRVEISVGESGPLIASLIIKSKPPGTHGLRCELRLATGASYVEIFNEIDKARLEAKNYRRPEGKESASFAFPLHVPNGSVLVDLPLAAMRPDVDQLPASCKGWLTVGRWTDVANADFGLTWVTLDAPLIQLTDPADEFQQWRADNQQRLKGSQKLSSWVMNNRWGTNYRAYQDGPTTFRYVLRPHRQSDSAEATRFATGFSQPLLVAPVSGSAQKADAAKPFLKLNSPDVIATSMKPSDDGKAIIVRLFGASGRDAEVALQWGGPSPRELFLSDTTEKPLMKAGERIKIPGFGLVTLRATFE